MAVDSIFHALDFCSILLMIPLNNFYNQQKFQCRNYVLARGQCICIFHDDPVKYSLSPTFIVIDYSIGFCVGKLNQLKNKF